MNEHSKDNDSDNDDSDLWQWKWTDDEKHKTININNINAWKSSAMSFSSLESSSFSSFIGHWALDIGHGTWDIDIVDDAWIQSTGYNISLSFLHVTKHFPNKNLHLHLHLPFAFRSLSAWPAMPCHAQIETVVGRIFLFILVLVLDLDLDLDWNYAGVMGEGWVVLSNGCGGDGVICKGG